MKRIQAMIRKFENLKLQTQFFLMVILLFMMTLIVGSFFLYYNILHKFQDKTEQSTIQSFKQAENSILAFRDELNRFSQSILTDSNVQEFLNHPNSPLLDQIEFSNGLRDKLTNSIGIYKFVQSIFIYTTSGNSVGFYDNKFYTTDRISQSKGILNSDLYLKNRLEFPRMIWSGGIKLSDFQQEFNTIDPDSGNLALISASRGIKAYYQSNQSGMLVINIVESRLSEIYKDVSNNVDEHIYILDQDEKIISANQPESIGVIKSNILLRLENTYGSFTTYDESNKQVIYYKLSDTGWILIREVPISVFQKDIVSLRYVILYMLLICSVIASFVSLYFTRRLLKPIRVLVGGMKDLGKGEIGITVSQSTSNEIGMMINQFNRMSLNIQEMMEQNSIVEQQKRKAELTALQAQINPHFLYNTLNTIKWMAINIRATNIANSLTALGNILRPIFSSPSANITLEEELAYIQNYMTIMNNRYGEGVTFDIDVSPMLNNFIVPRLLLQPLVENSLMHGLESANYKGVIRISAELQEGAMYITIQDNGIGIEEEKIKGITKLLTHGTDDSEHSHSGIGLLNVSNRIRYYYGMESAVQIERLPEGGTKIVLKIVLVHES